MRPSTPKAIAKVYQAMKKVEEAQRLMAEASQALSPLRNVGPLYSKTSKFYDQLHKFWYTLKNAAECRNGMSLDSECDRCGADLSGWRMGDATHRCDLLAHVSVTNTALPEGVGDDVTLEGDDR